ncbi:MAG: mandelate racemase/muconate lactonizing enzyme family protein [Solirubrobacterales bacterium]
MSAATIAEVEVLILDTGVEYGEPSGTAGELSGPRHLCLVRVTTEDGHVGYGDVDSHPWVVKAIVEARPHIPDFCAGLRDAVVGLPATDPAAAWRAMYRASWYHGRRGAAMHAISGVDIAVWDVAAQLESCSVAELLGGRRRESVRAYASTLFRAEPEAMRTAVRTYLDRGYTAIKFGWGSWGEDPDRDRDLFATACEEAGPDVDLMVDGYLGGDTVAQVRALEPLAPFWVEEPLPADSPDELAALGRATPLRIASGEQLGGISEFAELLREEGVSVVQPDLSRCGGFTALREIAELAKSRGCLVVPHSWSSHLLTAASLQAVAWLEEEPLIEVNASAAPVVSELAPLDLELDDGRVRVPDGPGLGVAVDAAVIERFRVA